MGIRRCKQLVVSSLLMLFLFACSNNNEFYYEFHSFESASWDESFICEFEVVIEDTVSLYDVLIEVRNNNNYPYRNLWLFVDFKTPEGKVRSDTLNCELADEFGKWYGKGLSLFDQDLPYDLAVSYPNTGTYKYSIRQGMREKELQGITDVGIKIRKAVNNIR